MSDSVWPRRRQPTRLPHPWDSLGKNTGVGCHFLLQYQAYITIGKVVYQQNTLVVQLPHLFEDNFTFNESTYMNIYLWTSILYYFHSRITKRQQDTWKQFCFSIVQKKKKKKNLPFRKSQTWVSIINKLYVGNESILFRNYIWPLNIFLYRLSKILMVYDLNCILWSSSLWK